MALSLEQIANFVVLVVTGTVVGIYTKITQVRGAKAIKDQLENHANARELALQKIDNGQKELLVQQNQIHILVNSNVQELKRLYMVALKTIYDLRGDELDRELAEEAAKNYREHVLRQTAVEEVTKA